MARIVLPLCINEPDQVGIHRMQDRAELIFRSEDKHGDSAIISLSPSAIEAVVNVLTTKPDRN